MDQRIAALRAQGLSVREIARKLGLSRMKVHRVLAATPVAPALADPVLALLTEVDLEHLGVSAAEVAGGLTALDRYRIMGLPPDSAAGDAARGLFDHRRGGDAWTAWLHAGRSPVKVAAEPVPAHVRDERIIELRLEGWTLQQIGDDVGMSKGAVSRALERIYSGRPGQQPRG